MNIDAILPYAMCFYAGFTAASLMSLLMIYRYGR